MNQAELLQYLRNNSTRCRINADTASDLDTAQTLLTMAEEIDLAILVLENRVEPAPDATPKANQSVAT